MKKIPKNDNVIENSLEEHSFIACCLKMGLRIEDLKQLKYKDVAKIMLCYIDNENIANKKNNRKKATQSDIDKLLG